MACAANIWPPVHLNCYKQSLTASSNCCHSFLLKSNAKRRCLIFSFWLDNEVCWLNSAEPSMKQLHKPLQAKKAKSHVSCQPFLLIINNKTEPRLSSVRKRANTQNKLPYISLISLHVFLWLSTPHLLWLYIPDFENCSSIVINASCFHAAECPYKHYAREAAEPENISVNFMLPTYELYTRWPSW